MRRTDQLSPAVLQVESWLPVVGAEGFYEVSSFGRLRSVGRLIATRSGATRVYGGDLIRGKPGNAGHLYVSLSIGHEIETALIHVLVCTAFHGLKPADKDLVAHWDGNPSNNWPENLRWATFEENEEDKRRHDRHTVGERNPGSKLSEFEVAEIRRRHDHSRGIGALLADEFGVSRTTISSIAKGDTWSVEGNAARRARRGIIRVDPFLSACSAEFGRAVPTLRDWGLTPGDVPILSALLAGRMRVRVLGVIRGTNQAVYCRISKLRKTLGRQGLTLRSSNAGGAWLDEADVAAIRAAHSLSAPALEAAA